MAGIVHTPDAGDLQLGKQPEEQSHILAIAALCRPLFSDVMFKKFERTLFLGKADDRGDNYLRLLHEWQYFFLELCGTVCDSLRRAGRVSDTKADDVFSPRHHELPVADEAGELLTAEHFHAVKNMVALCQRCLQDSPSASDDLLNVAFRCMGAVINLVQYVGNRSVWASDDLTDRVSLSKCAQK